MAIRIEHAHADQRRLGGDTWRCEGTLGDDSGSEAALTGGSKWTRSTPGSAARARIWAGVSSATAAPSRLELPTTWPPLARTRLTARSARSGDGDATDDALAA